MWNFYTRINFFFSSKKKNLNIKKNTYKKIKVLIVKPFYYPDLYNAFIKDNLDTIISSRYRMGPAGIISNFQSKVILSNYYEEKKINLEEYMKMNLMNITQRTYQYLRKQFQECLTLDDFDFSKYDWVISIKDCIPEKIIKKNPSILWTKLFEDHREKNYLRENYFGSKKYDLTFNTTQGYTPYGLFKNTRSVDFPYSFNDCNFSDYLNLNLSNKKNILLEIHQPKINYLSSTLSLPVLKLDGKLSIFEYFKMLSSSKYFFCPNYKLPRWGNSIIEAGIFNCLIIGNPNSFWNSLLIQKECVCSSFDQGIEIIQRFEKNPKFYQKVLKRQQDIIEQINFYNPLYQIKSAVLKKFKYKKISKFL